MHIAQLQKSNDIHEQTRVQYISQQKITSTADINMQK